MAINGEGRKARFERWETYGVEAIRQDLASGAFRLVGATPEVRELAREWVRLKEAEQTTAKEKHEDVVTMKLGIWGMSVNLNELGRRICDRFKKS